jgi:hypothetical protein
VICRSHHNDVGRQAVNLEQKGTHNSLNFASIVDISTFFPESVELIEKQNARASRDIVEKFMEPAGGFT